MPSDTFAGAPPVMGWADGSCKLDAGRRLGGRGTEAGRPSGGMRFPPPLLLDKTPLIVLEVL